MAYDSTTDSVLFEYWFEHVFLKSIPKYLVAIMDNAAFHRKKRLRELAEKAECDLLFLPPYPPDFNPIENFWAWLKSRLRKIFGNVLNLLPQSTDTLCKRKYEVDYGNDIITLSLLWERECQQKRTF